MVFVKEFLGGGERRNGTWERERGGERGGEEYVGCSRRLLFAASHHAKQKKSVYPDLCHISAVCVYVCVCFSPNLP